MIADERAKDRWFSYSIVVYFAQNFHIVSRHI